MHAVKTTFQALSRRVLIAVLSASHLNCQSKFQINILQCALLSPPPQKKKKKKKPKKKQPKKNTHTHTSKTCKGILFSTASGVGSLEQGSPKGRMFQDPAFRISFSVSDIFTARTFACSSASPWNTMEEPLLNTVIKIRAFRFWRTLCCDTFPTRLAHAM